MSRPGVGLIFMGLGGSGQGEEVDPGRQLEEFLLFGLVMGDFVPTTPAGRVKRRKSKPLPKPIPEDVRQREFQEQLDMAAARLKKGSAEVQAAKEKIGVDANLKQTKRRLAKLLAEERSKARKH